MNSQLPSRDDFLTKYCISLSNYRKSGLKWNDLKDIYNDYIEKRSDYDRAASLLADKIFSIDGVHSVKKRTKDPEHLIEKIIRKSIEYNKIYATIDTYEDVVTDIIGIRAIHLYKEDWPKIHEHMLKNMKLLNTPTAFVSKGERGKHIENYKCQECKIKEHKADYRSVHYSVVTQPFNRNLIAEIQVRTIFEEGWSEMDHDIRYPYDQNNEIYLEYLSTFNDLCRTADKMGSFLSLLKAISSEEQHFEKILKERDDRIDMLSKKIEELEGSELNKNEISKEISMLKAGALVPEIMETTSKITPIGGMLTKVALAVVMTQFLKGR
ncbi:MAG: RelA/SpoT domain-containing protein [Pseudodesulfovibrio sp.]|uniref:RelA/SpoT domain-containing protein n=1 Tax=Pseudodesulfovibrio sp. TaxID=2035812 RepID=UPI003D0F8239